MSDSNWIRSVNDKNVYTAGQMQAGTMRSNGRLSTGEYLQVDGVAVENQPCGARTVGLDANGLTLSCQSGVWTRAYKPLFVGTYIGAFGAGAINPANYVGSKPYAVQFTGCGSNVQMDGIGFVYNSFGSGDNASCGSITVSNNVTHTIGMPWGGSWVVISGYWQ